MNGYGAKIEVGGLSDDKALEMLAFNLTRSEQVLAGEDGGVRWTKPPEFGVGTPDQMPEAFRTVRAKGNLKADRLDPDTRYAWWYAEREESDG